MKGEKKEKKKKKRKETMNHIREHNREQPAHKHTRMRIGMIPRQSTQREHKQTNDKTEMQNKREERDEKVVEVLIKGSEVLVEG